MTAIVVLLLVMVVAQVGTALLPLAMSSITSMVNMLVSFGSLLLKVLIGPFLVTGLGYLLYDSFKKEEEK